MEVALTGDAALASEVERVTWEPKRAVNSRPMRALEARISQALAVENVKFEKILSLSLHDTLSADSLVVGQRLSEPLARVQIPVRADLPLFAEITKAKG